MIGRCCCPVRLKHLIIYRHLDITGRYLEIRPANEYTAMNTCGRRHGLLGPVTANQDADRRNGLILFLFKPWMTTHIIAVFAASRGFRNQVQQHNKSQWSNSCTKENNNNVNVFFTAFIPHKLSPCRNRRSVFSSSLQYIISSVSSCSSDEVIFLLLYLLVDQFSFCLIRRRLLFHLRNLYTHRYTSWIS